MKTRLICLCLLVLSLWFNALGQAEDAPKSTKFGVGISLEPLHIFTLGSSAFSNALLPVSIYFSVNAPSFSFEPEFGIFSYSYESGPSTNKSSLMKIGLSALFPVTQGASTRVYLGPRAGFLFVSQSSSTSGSPTYTSDFKETDLIMGLAAGGEYYVSSQFSVGGEAQINYYSFGKPTTSTTPSYGPSSSTDRSQSFIATSGLFFLRFYF